MKHIATFLAVVALALAETVSALSGLTKAGEKQTPAPNLLVDVSAHLINKAVSQTVDRTEPFEEVIQNIPVCGMRRTVGNVRVELFPDPDRATLELVLAGCNYSRDVGSGPCVWIHTTTAVPFEVRQPLAIDAQGVRIYPGPAQARATINLLGIVNERGQTDTFNTRLARLSFNQNKADAEAEVAFKTARASSWSFEQELAPALLAANQSFAQALDSSRRTGLTLELLQFSTTPAWLQMRARIAAPGPRPQAPPELPADADLALRAHQSMVNELHRGMLGGKTYRPGELRDLANRMIEMFFRDPRTKAAQADSAQLLNKLLAGMKDKSLTVTLAEKDPVAVAFAGQAFTITLHVRQVRLNGKVYAGARVTADYKLVKAQQGAQIVRQGDLRIRPPDAPSGSEKLEPLPVALALPMVVLAGEILKERLILAGPPLPEQLSRLGLFTSQASIQNGWVKLAWKLKKGS